MKIDWVGHMESAVHQRLVACRMLIAETHIEFAAQRCSDGGGLSDKRAGQRLFKSATNRVPLKVGSAWLPTSTEAIGRVLSATIDRSFAHAAETPTIDRRSVGHPTGAFSAASRLPRQRAGWYLKETRMDINAKFEVSVWGVLCVIGATAVVVAGGVWGVAKMTESNELQAYKTAKDWKATDAIASLQELSKSAKLDADEQKELLSLRRRLPELERTLSETSSQFVQARTEAFALRDTLASVIKNIDQVEVPIRESRYVIPQTVLVGVHTIYTSRCGVRVGDRSEFLEIGQPFRLLFAGKEYVLTLSKLSETSCTFAFAEKSIS